MLAKPNNAKKSAGTMGKSLHRSYRGFLYFTRVDAARHLSEWQERPALRVLIWSVKSDQSKGILAAGIPERVV